MLGKQDAEHHYNLQDYRLRELVMGKQDEMTNLSRCLGHVFTPPETFARHQKIAISIYRRTLSNS
jgi:hypothetical protein